jgi:hypothetical protein
MDNNLADPSELPRWFLVSLGVAVALQVLTCAWAVAEQDGRDLAVLLAGLLVLAAVGGLGLARFHHVRSTTLASRVVLGSTSPASSAYVLSLGGATWAFLADQWWWALAAAAAGGWGYAAGGARWWRDHRAEVGDEHTWLAVLGLLGLAGVVALVVVG